MKQLKNFTISLTLMLAMGVLGVANANSVPHMNTCKGRLINPVNDVNWSYIYRFTMLSGIKVGSGHEVFLHRMPAVLKCPHQVLPGVGITFHSPDWLAEVTKDPMCIVSLPGFKITKSFDRNRGAKKASKKDPSSGSYSHVHLFSFDVLKILDFFKTFIGCLDASESTSSFGGVTFGVKFLSELDPVHSNSLWAVAFAPESLIFSNPAALISCIPDELSSSFFGQPLDPLFWCQGQNGTVYPFDGWTDSDKGDTSNNISIIQKHLAKGSRMFIYPSTIGPWAQCMTLPLGVITKSQYEFDPTFPKARRGGKKIYYGTMSEKWALGRMYNNPSPKNGGDSAYVVWRARQCSVSK